MNLYDIFHNNELKNSLINRFWKKVIKKNENYCWSWTGSIIAGGYGKIYLGGNSDKTIAAHRVSYILHYGWNPFFNELCVCHKCDNPSCVNPNHLFLGTHKENQEDKISKERIPIGSSCNWSKLNENDIINILSDTRLLKDIAKNYNVSIGTISNIKLKKSWKHINNKSINNNHLVKLTDNEIIDIFYDSRSYKDIAIDYNISYSHIYSIKNKLKRVNVTQALTS